MTKRAHGKIPLPIAGWDQPIIDLALWNQDMIGPNFSG
jgi:hypothetical protein